jgi:hypothetical protein
MDNKLMYTNPGIKTTQVIFMDNKFMYKNPGIRKTQVMFMDNKFMYKIPGIKQRKFFSWIINSCTQILE